MLGLFLIGLVRVLQLVDHLDLPLHVDSLARSLRRNQARRSASL